MSEIVKVSSESVHEHPELENGGLEAIPESVRILFSKLSATLKGRIFLEDSEATVESSEEDRERSLVDTVARLDTKSRERFMVQCLIELFDHGKFKDVFETMSLEKLKVEIERLLNLLWHNREQVNSPQLFNEEFYESFFAGREVIWNKINEKKLEIEQQVKNISYTIKQKRLTERKKQELTSMEIALGEYVSELRRYDFQHGNSDLDRTYSRGVADRQRQETQWTKATVVTSQYLDSAEFATVMAEQLERTFYRESSFAQYPKREWFGKPIPLDVLERARKITHSITQAVEEWHAMHQNDGAFKKSIEAKQEERQAKLIDYFVSLVKSYKIAKESNRTDAEMTYTIRQMEVCLNILAKQK